MQQTSSNESGDIISKRKTWLDTRVQVSFVNSFCNLFCQFLLSKTWNIYIGWVISCYYWHIYDCCAGRMASGCANFLSPSFLVLLEFVHTSSLIHNMPRPDIHTYFLRKKVCVSMVVVSHLTSHFFLTTISLCCEMVYFLIQVSLPWHHDIDENLGKESEEVQEEAPAKIVILEQRKVRPQCGCGVVCVDNPLTYITICNKSIWLWSLVPCDVYMRVLLNLWTDNSTPQVGFFSSPGHLSSIEGKVLGYFWVSNWHPWCRDFFSGWLHSAVRSPNESSHH